MGASAHVSRDYACFVASLAVVVTHSGVSRKSVSQERKGLTLWASGICAVKIRLSQTSRSCRPQRKASQNPFYELDFCVACARSTKNAVDAQTSVPLRSVKTGHSSTVQRAWVTAIGLEPSGYDTHSMRRTKAAEIYRKTGNLRAVQLLLGHTKVDSTVRYLGVELEDALSIAENIDI